MANYAGKWKTVDVKVEAGIAWVTFNRPEKRNAMSPTLNSEMIQVLETLELDADARVLVLTGAGDAWTAGMDLKEYFREIDAGPEILQEKIRRDACQLAVEIAAHVCEADHRDGQRLVLWRRLFAARRVRPRHRGRRSRVRSFRDQLGHSAGQSGQQGDGRYGRTSSGAALHHDR